MPFASAPSCSVLRRDEPDDPRRQIDGSAEDRTATAYQYDRQDKVTAVSTSPTLDLRVYASAQAISTIITLAGSIRSTTSTYDKLGRLREQRDLSTTHQA